MPEKAPPRRAAPGDAADLARLLHDFNSEFDDVTPGVEFLTHRFRELLSEGEVVALLIGAGPDGFAQLRFRPAVLADGLEAYLEELYVIPGRRGQGLGRALLEAAMDLARETGAVGISLNTGETDEAARALYESCGFTNLEGPEGPPMLFYEREL